MGHRVFPPRIAVVTVALVGFACGEPAGPVAPPNPAMVLPLYAAIDSVLSGRLLTIQGTLGIAFHPPRDGALVFPDSVLGHTFEWDSLSNSYQATARGGAPGRGVSAILYNAVLPDGFTPEPARPFLELGRTDVIHESPGTTNNLRTIVRDTSGFAYGNYLTSAVLGTNAFEIRSSGYLSLPDKRVNFVAFIGISNGDVTTDYTLTVPARDLWMHIIVHGGAIANGQTASATLVLRHGGDVVDMQGTLTEVFTAPNASVTSADVTFRINGQVFATILGTDPNVLYADQDGRDLTQTMARVVQRTFQAPNRIHDAISRVLQPSVNLLSGLTP